MTEDGSTTTEDTSGMTEDTSGMTEDGSGMTEARTYESAVGRVEEIIRRLDSGDAGLRETLDLVREGRELVEYCATELDAVSQGLEELRLEELVARLETGDGGR
jgi:exodeoxyribonuclease VII small subunit